MFALLMNSEQYVHRTMYIQHHTDDISNKDKPNTSFVANASSGLPKLALGPTGSLELLPLFLRVSRSNWNSGSIEPICLLCMEREFWNSSC